MLVLIIKSKQKQKTKRNILFLLSVIHYVCYAYYETHAVTLQVNSYVLRHLMI